MDIGRHSGRLGPSREGLGLPRAHTRRRSTAAVLLLALLALALVAASPAASSTRSGQAHAAKTQRLTARQKAAGRRSLARRVKLNPRVIFTPGFIHKAVIYNFDMPLRMRLDPTVVLPNTVCGQRALNPGCTAPVSDVALGGLANADDLMQTDLTTENDPPTPLGPTTKWAPPVPSRIAGTIDVTMHFDKETGGFGSPGTFDLTLDWFNLTATGFDLVQDNSGCTLLKTAPTFAITPAEQTAGSFNVLTGTFFLRLRTRYAFSALRRATCAAAPATPFTWTKAVAGTDDPPIPIVMQGKFEISPSFTLDRFLRFGKVTVVDAPGSAQENVFASVHTCTVATGTPDTSPPPPGTCDNDPLDELVIPSRVKPLSITTEVMFGRP